MFVGATAAADGEPGNAGAGHAKDFRYVLEAVRLLDAIGLRYAAILEGDQAVLDDA